MRHAKLFQLLLALLLNCALLVPSGSAADKKEIIRQARQSYYNLPSQGLFEVQSTVTPNWNAFLHEELKSDIPPDHPALKLLNGLHFWLSLDQKGAAKISHQIDTTPASQESFNDLNQTISGVEQMLSGFAQSVSPFLFTSPFPEVESEYHLEEQGDQYRITYKEGDFNVTTTMKKDFAITDLLVTGPAFTASLKPQFTKTDKGFLINGYQGNYQFASGKESHLAVQMEYNNIEGFQLPGKLLVDATADGRTHKWQLQFSGYQVKKRGP
jgi:hypothetical protein